MVAVCKTKSKRELLLLCFYVHTFADFDFGFHMWKLTKYRYKRDRHCQRLCCHIRHGAMLFLCD